MGWARLLSKGATEQEVKVYSNRRPNFASQT
jgi:hypothetical protein